MCAVTFEIPRKLPESRGEIQNDKCHPPLHNNKRLPQQKQYKISVCLSFTILTPWFKSFIACTSYIPVFPFVIIYMRHTVTIFHCNARIPVCKLFFLLTTLEGKKLYLFCLETNDILTQLHTYGVKAIGM